MLVACIIGVFAILSSTMSKNPVLNPFADSLGTPDALMGFVAAASTLPGILISFPVGSLSDRWGRRRVVLASCVVFATAPFLYLAVTAWWHLVAVRFYHGFATAIFIPVARATLAERYPSQKGAQISTFTAATLVGRGIAPFLGGFILAVTVWNFHLLYVAVGTAGVTTLVLAVAFLREAPGPAPPEPSRRRSTSGPTESASRGWGAVVGNPKILLASTTEAAARYVYGALEFFLIGYLKNVALLDPSLIGIIMGVQIVLIPVASPVLGRLSDRMGRATPIAAGLVISGIPLVAIPYVTGFLPLLLIAMVYGLGFATVVASTPALIGDLASRASIGAAMGFLSTVMDVGQMLGPLVTGVILAVFGYTGSFLSLAVILVGVALLFAVLHRVQ
jgi:MFS family permease